VCAQALKDQRYAHLYEGESREGCEDHCGNVEGTHGRTQGKLYEVGETRTLKCLDDYAERGV